MKRDLEFHLLSWQKQTDRKPLILRGARQVGKSYLLESFGKTRFDTLITLNFEKQPSLCEIFSGDIQIPEILQKLELIANARIVPGRTLLFLDEIQHCPQALTALRYFKEEKPDLHVAAAGSLLDFALDGASVPVGRVTYLTLHPMSFQEFLAALGEDLLLESLATALPRAGDAVHAKLLTLVRKYAMIGGMPEAVKTYLATRSLLDVGRVHADLIESFRQDFSKYARQARYPQLLKVLERIPKHIGDQIKYAGLDRDSRSQEIKDAVLLLERARVIHRVRATSGKGLPLGADASDKTFKAIFIDIGLMQHVCGIDWSRVSDSEDFTAINAGALAEQFVGQELLAYADPTLRPELYYWKREERSSTAEVDYVIAHSGEACPVEVKNAAGGRLKSLHLFRLTYAPPKAFVVSSHPHDDRDGITRVPFYGVRTLV